MRYINPRTLTPAATEDGGRRLYQGGALTKEEFEEVKRTVIAKHYGA